MYCKKIILIFLLLIGTLKGNSQNGWRFDFFTDNLQIPLTLYYEQHKTYLTHPHLLSRVGLEINKEFYANSWVNSIGLSGFYNAYWMSYDLVDIRMQGKSYYYVQQRVNTAGLGLSYSGEKYLNHFNQKLDSAGFFSVGLKLGADFYHLESPEVEAPYYYQNHLKIESINGNSIDFRSLIFVRYSRESGRFKNFGLHLGSGLSMVRYQKYQANYQLGVFYRIGSKAASQP